MSADASTPAGAGPRGIGHFTALDGLRGVALAGVLFFHANGMLPGGYLGVDLFFVLSGFLITSLLLAERERTGTITLSAFWVRRARRLFPALLSLMPAVAAYGWLLATPTELATVRGDALATLAYVANWRTILAHKSYWDLFAHPSPLEHTWSLSIEEQFYVVWPLFVAIVLAKGSRKALLLLSGLLLVLSIGAMLVLFDPENVSRVYLGTDTRASGILAGAILACVLRPAASASIVRTRVVDALGLGALLFLGAAWCLLRGEDWILYHGGFWLTELACLALITCAITPGSLVARVLSFRLFTWLGTVSYGAYLWHWPVDIVLTAERTHLRGLALVGVQLAVTFTIAFVSYHVLEQPIRKRGVPFGRPMLVVPSAVAAAVLLVVRATFARPEPPAPPPPVPIPPPAIVTYRIMLVGDSTANSLGWGLRGVQRPGLAIENMGRDGCTMLADTCYGEKWIENVQTVKPNATLLYVGGAFLHGITVKGRFVKACNATWDEKFETNVDKRLGDLTSVPGDVWAATIPYPLGPYDSEPYRKETDCINASIRKAAAAHPSVKVVDIGEALCPKGECTLEAHGKTIRADGVHYDIDGIRDVATFVLDAIDPAVDAGAGIDLDAGTATR
ncbi:MAG TPA: acyltransferase [Polyangiaceae bacterium]